MSNSVFNKRSGRGSAKELGLADNEEDRNDQFMRGVELLTAIFIVDGYEKRILELKGISISSPSGKTRSPVNLRLVMEIVEEDELMGDHLPEGEVTLQ